VGKPDENVSILDFICAMHDGGGGDNWTIRCAKLQSNCHQQQSNTQRFTRWMPFLSPNQQRHSTEGKEGVQKLTTDNW